MIARTGDTRIKRSPSVAPHPKNLKLALARMPRYEDRQQYGVRIMMAGSHVVVGIAAWTLVAPHFGLSPLDPVALGFTILGSLLPDIDHPSSWVGRRVPVISRAAAAILGYRGVTHSALAVLVCLTVLRGQGFSRVVIDALVIGYLSHLGADLLTSSGLRLAWPSRKRQVIPLCRTGSSGESLIVAGVAIWAGIAIFRRHPMFGL
jgi:inner membrane protein